MPTASLTHTERADLTTALDDAHAASQQAWNDLGTTTDPKARAQLLGQLTFQQARINWHHELLGIGAAGELAQAELRLTVLRVLTDVEYAVNWPDRGRRWRDTCIEPVAGEILHRMATTIDPDARRAMLADLYEVLAPCSRYAARILREIPAPGYSGWRRNIHQQGKILAASVGAAAAAFTVPYGPAAVALQIIGLALFIWLAVEVLGVHFELPRRQPS